MIFENLLRIVQRERQLKTNRWYIRSLLKEYLQMYLLYFIYTEKEYKDNFIFTGGTCLRHFYGLERLSEDIDFDYLKKVDAGKLRKDVENFFFVKYKYKDLRVSLKQKNKQVLLKFKVMQKLALADRNESNWLYVKIDLSANNSKYYSAITSSKSEFGFNFIARHYDLSTLMTNKIDAIFNREIFKGRDNKLTIKGRDYYDLMWFLKQEVKPNMERLRDLWKEKDLTLQRLADRLEERVEEVNKRYLLDFENDLVPFLRNTEVIGGYVNNYLAEFRRSSKVFRGGG